MVSDYVYLRVPCIYVTYFKLRFVTRNALINIVSYRREHTLHGAFGILYILYIVSGVKRHMGIGFCKITIKCYAPTPRGVEMLPIKMYSYILQYNAGKGVRDNEVHLNTWDNDKTNLSGYFHRRDGQTGHDVEYVQKSRSGYTFVVIPLHHFVNAAFVCEKRQFYGRVN